MLKRLKNFKSSFIRVITTLWNIYVADCYSEGQNRFSWIWLGVWNSVAVEDKNSELSLGIKSGFPSIDTLSPWFSSHQSCQGPPAAVWMTEPCVEASCRKPGGENSALHSPWWSYILSDKWGKYFCLPLSSRKFYYSHSLSLCVFTGIFAWVIINQTVQSLWSELLSGQFQDRKLNYGEVINWLCYISLF